MIEGGMQGAVYEYFDNPTIVSGPKSNIARLPPDLVRYLREAGLSFSR